MSDEQLTLDDLSDSENKESETSRVPRAAHIEHVAFGGLPDDWSWAKSKNYLEYIRSGISESQNKDGNGIPVSRIETISDGVVNYNKVGYIPDEQDYEKDRLKAGDLLFSNINSREEIGKTAIYHGENPLYHGMNLLRIKYNTESFNPFFAYYVYDSPMAQDVFFRMSKAAVGQSSINQSQMEKLYLPQPSLEEQRKIASVLYTVNQAIQKTKKIPEQMETVQQGLLQTLFGKGFTKDQADPETKTERLGPKQFRVPDAWEVTNISSIGRVVTGDTPSTDDEDNFGGDLPFVTPETLSHGKYVNHSDRTISESGRNEAKPIPEDSVMMECIGNIDKVAIADREVATNQQINSVIVTDPNYDSEFLYYHLQLLKDFIRSQAGKTAVPIVNKGNFESFSIFKPPIEEQRNIVETLSIYDEGKHANKEYLTKLERLKKGLMQDLLSGKVRTHDKDIELIDDVLQHG